MKSAGLGHPTYFETTHDMESWSLNEATQPYAPEPYEIDSGLAVQKVTVQ